MGLSVVETLIENLRNVMEEKKQAERTVVADLNLRLISFSLTDLRQSTQS